MALTKSYYNLLEDYTKKYGPKTFLLMQVGSFFEVYSSTENDPIMMAFSQICDLKIAHKQDGFMAGFRDYLLEKYLSKINESSYTSVVFVQEEVNGTIQRKESAVYSPGTTFLDEEIKLSNNVTCIWIHKTKKDIIFGLSNLDIYTGKLNVYEYNQVYYHNPTTYDTIEKFMSIYRPIEIIFIYNVEEILMDHILQYLRTNSKKITRIPLTIENPFKTQAHRCENQVYQNEILRNFYPNISQKQLLYTLFEKTIAFQALCFLLNYVSQHNPSLTHLLKEPEVEPNDTLILANHSLKQLNILDGEYFGEYSSILKLLNTCRTKIGQREMQRIILNPTQNVVILQESYDMTEHCLTFKYSWPSLNQIKDIEKIIRKMILNRATPSDYHSVYETCIIVKELITSLNSDSKTLNYIHAIETLEEIRKIQDSIALCLNLDIARPINTLQFDKYDTTQLIIKGFNPELDESVRAKLESHDKLMAIINYLNEIFPDKKIKDAVKIHETSSLTFLITKKRKILLNQRILDLDVKKAIVNITFKSSYLDKSDTFQFNLLGLIYKDYNATTFEIDSPEISDILSNLIFANQLFNKKIIETFNSVHENMSSLLYNSLIYTIQQLDTLHTKCELTTLYNYSKPVIDSREISYVSIRKLRHPLIEHLEKNELYVTNDIEIGLNTKGILLFGTNAVGKTSLIKALGICVIMAQAGLYVPCESMTYSPYEYIFTRIIGNDNIFKGLSTFGVEMSELRVILNHCNSRSLILGDELCSGTEIDSALSIFTAGLEKMYVNNSTFIFATHFHQMQYFDEIKAMDKIALKHLKVQYNNETKQLIYDRKLAEGAGESIYGLEVCKSLQMPDDFLKRAYEIRGNDKDKNVLNLNITRHNKNKVRGICEFCKKTLGSEIHHLRYQKEANDKDYIGSFHKDHPANLASICEPCHHHIHSLGLIYEKRKTSDGYNLILI